MHAVQIERSVEIAGEDDLMATCSASQAVNYKCS